MRNNVHSLVIIYKLVAILKHSNCKFLIYHLKQFAVEKKDDRATVKAARINYWGKIIAAFIALIGIVVIYMLPKPELSKTTKKDNPNNVSSVESIENSKDELIGLIKIRKESFDKDFIELNSLLDTILLEVENSNLKEKENIDKSYTNTTIYSKANDLTSIADDNAIDSLKTLLIQEKEILAEFEREISFLVAKKIETLEVGHLVLAHEIKIDIQNVQIQSLINEKSMNKWKSFWETRRLKRYERIKKKFLKKQNTMCPIF